MSSPEVLILGIFGAFGGVLAGTGLIGPTVMFSDAGYAMVGVIVSSLMGATATVAVAYISITAQRRSRDEDDSDDKKDDPPRKSR